MSQAGAGGGPEAHDAVLRLAPALARLHAVLDDPDCALRGA